MKENYAKTRFSCYVGYIVQAVIANLPPLLFVIYREEFGVSNEQLGRLVLMFFVAQIIVDLLSGIFAEKLGVRACILTADLCAAAGLGLLGVLPRVMTGAPYPALCICAVLYAIGAGFIEVIISPIIEALPSGRKSASMSILHSFYCWGQMGAVLLSTVFLRVAGRQVWYLLPLLWALVPAFNFVMFLRAPLVPIPSDETGASLKSLFSAPMLVVCFIVMVCSGASELSMAQWASLFAEKALGVPKMIGDLAGPCLFALLMGLTRAFGSRLSEKYDFTRLLSVSAALCVGCYALTVFSPLPVFSLLGCAMTGLSIALMWPTTLSLAASRFPGGGTRMFAMLAVFGDIGCALGPWLTGFVSDRVRASGALFSAFPALSAEELGLKAGLFAAMLFPVLMLFCLAAMRRMKKPAAEN